MVVSRARLGSHDLSEDRVQAMAHLDTHNPAAYRTALPLYEVAQCTGEQRVERSSRDLAILRSQDRSRLLTN